MASAGFAVPDGFCLTTAVYKQFVDANDLQAQIVTLAAPAVVKGVVSFEAASIAIQALFDAPIPEDIVAEATAVVVQILAHGSIVARGARKATTPMLFNLSDDPGETNDLAAQYPDRVKVA